MSAEKSPVSECCACEFPHGGLTDVSNLLISPDSAAQNIAHLRDVADELLWSSTWTTFVLDTSWRDAVQVLRTYRNTNDRVGELLAILRDGSPQSCELLVESLLACTAPDTEQQRCVGRDGGWKGRNDRVCRVALHHGKETCGCEAAYTGKLLRSPEVGLEIGLLTSDGVGVEGAIVEAADLSRSSTGEGEKRE